MHDTYRIFKLSLQHRIDRSTCFKQKDSRISVYDLDVGYSLMEHRSTLMEVGMVIRWMYHFLQPVWTTLMEVCMVIRWMYHFLQPVWTTLMEVCMVIRWIYNFLQLVWTTLMEGCMVIRWMYHFRICHAEIWCLVSKLFLKGVLCAMTFTRFGVCEVGDVEFLDEVVSTMLLEIFIELEGDRHLVTQTRCKHIS